jgi:hypothetical protein
VISGAIFETSVTQDSASVAVDVYGAAGGDVLINDPGVPSFAAAIQLSKFATEILANEPLVLTVARVRIQAQVFDLIGDLSETELVPTAYYIIRVNGKTFAEAEVSSDSATEDPVVVERGPYSIPLKTGDVAEIVASAASGARADESGQAGFSSDYLLLADFTRVPEPESGVARVAALGSLALLARRRRINARL